jgi:hypothetical protein
LVEAAAGCPGRTKLTRDSSRFLVLTNKHMEPKSSSHLTRNDPRLAGRLLTETVIIICTVLRLLKDAKASMSSF